MTDILKSYEEYKFCPYTEKIPYHWDIKKLCLLFKENKNLNTSMNETNALQFKFGEIIEKQKFELDEIYKTTISKYTIVEPMDLVINGLNLNYDFVTQRVGLVKKRGVITSSYISLTPRQDINSRYYSLLLKSYDARKIFNGMGSGIRLTLDYSELKKMELPLPPRDEQDKIVHYLDSKILKIDKLINAKKRQIELLKEQKVAVVNNAVTKGLNNDVKMKHSGVEWLGNIPEGWSIKPLRQILSPISIKNRPDLPLLSVVREKGVIIRDVDNKEENHNFIPDDLSGYKVVKKGQFVMNKMKAWQGSYGVSKHEGIVSPAYYIFDLNFDNIDYFHYAIRSKVYVNFFAQASDGIRVGQWDLSLQKMKEIPFIIPTKEEQKEIVEYIPKIFKSIDNAIHDIEREIKLVEEYKTALISNIVTGKLDVRNISVDIDNNEIKNY